MIKGLAHLSIFILFLTLLGNPTPSYSAEHVALVIGNADYAGESADLDNAINDAEDMAAALKASGFKVHLITNATKLDMEREIQFFSYKTMGSDFSLFYFAGHGIQVGNENYLVPVDMDFKNTKKLSERLVSFTLARSRATFGTNHSLILLDACRDNPLLSEFTKAEIEKSRKLGIGLAPLSEDATMIAMATQPGAVALDGTGRNSPFTSALLNGIKQGNLTLEALFENVRSAVTAETKGKQVPWSTNPDYAKSFKIGEPDEGSITGKPYLSDKTVLTLGEYAWRIAPEYYEKQGASIKIEKTPEFRAKHEVDLAFKRDLTVLGLWSANLKSCGMASRSDQLVEAMYRNSEAAGITRGATFLTAHMQHHVISIFLLGTIQVVDSDGTTKKGSSPVKFDCSEASKAKLARRIDHYLAASR